MSWSSQKKKEGIFCTFYFVQRKTFMFYLNAWCIEYILRICTYENIYSKNITSYTFLLVENILCIVDVKCQFKANF